MRYALFTLLLYASISSCCRRHMSQVSKSVSIDSSTTVSEKIRYIDTILSIDSSISIVKYHCDSLDRLVIDTVFQPSHSSRPAPKVHRLSSGILAIVCPADSLRIQIAIRDQIIQTKIHHIEKIEAMIEEKKGLKEKIHNLLSHLIVGILFSGISLALYIIRFRTR